MERREAYDFAAAEAAFDALVDYCPDYAEGYNQRAFVNFLRQDYEAALPDLERALDRSPRHVGALSGLALTLIALQRPGEAAVALRRALDLNPWLSERHLLPGLEALEEDL
jgi:tetratricopeptide (TPR) repeat protein